MKPVSKPGEHGTLFLYRITYRDAFDPGCPDFSKNVWGYNRTHVEDKFFDSDDSGWTILSVERVASV
jgi:hypothetical protein